MRFLAFKSPIDDQRTAKREETKNGEVNEKCPSEAVELDKAIQGKSEFGAQREHYKY
jgi:hypothetical protein